MQQFFFFYQHLNWRLHNQSCFLLLVRCIAPLYEIDAKTGRKDTACLVLYRMASWKTQTVDKNMEDEALESLTQILFLIFMFLFSFPGYIHHKRVTLWCDSFGW